MNVQNITLDLSKAIMAGQIVRMGQGDNEGTTIHATILDNSTVPSLTGMSARFYMRMPDGIHYVRDTNCTISGNVITYVVDEEHCCAVAGYTDEAYFEVVSGSTEYSTSRFRVKVERAAHDGAVPTESWDNAIEELISRGEQAVEDAEQAVDDAEQAVSDAQSAVSAANTAVSNANQAVSSANAAASNANQAASSANTAAGSANTAAADARNAASSATSAAQSANNAADSVEDVVDRAEDAIEAMGDISELAVPLMTQDTRGGSKLHPKGGLALEDERLRIGDIALESDGTDAGPIYELSAKGHAEQFSTTGKNLCARFSSGANNGVTFTVKADGSVATNGFTSSSSAALASARFNISAGTYTLSGCPSGGGDEVYRIDLRDSNGSVISNGHDNGSGKTFTLSSSYTNCYCVIRFGTSQTANNLVFYPQLELGSTATAYEPYTGGAPSPSPEFPQTIELCRGRNLIEYTLASLKALNTSGTWSGNEYTLNGVTYTVNSDMSISTSGTASGGHAGLLLSSLATADFLKRFDITKSYWLSGCPKGGSYTSYYLRLLTSSPWTQYAIDVGSGGATGFSSFQTSGDYVRVILGMDNGTNANNLTFRPQLELGSKATPYVPYGHVGLEVRGRNVYRETKFAVGETWTNGVVIRKLGYNEYAVNGTSDGTKWLTGLATDTSSGLFVTLAAGTYTASLGGNASNLDIAVRGLVNGDVTVIATGDSPQTFTLSAETKVKVAARTAINKTYNNQRFAIQLELGSTPHAYQPYCDSTTPIPLPSRGWVAGLPDGTADSLRLDGAGKCEWRNEIAEEIWDGTEGWSLTENPGFRRFNYKNEQNKASISFENLNELSDHFVELNSNAGTWGHFYIHSNGWRVVQDKNSAIASLSDFITWLSTHNVTILYPVENPTTELGYIEDWPTDIPDGATITIPELDALNVKYFVTNDSISQYAEQWYERTKAVDIAQVEDAVVELTENLVDSTTLDPIGGLERVSDGVRIGSLVQESDGYARGGLAEVTANGHAEQFSTTGKNLAKPYYDSANNGSVNGIAWTYKGNGVWHASGTATSSSRPANGTQTFVTDTLGAGTYTAHCECDNSNVLVRIGRNSDNAYVGSAYTGESFTFTVETAQAYRINFQVDANTTIDVDMFCQLEFGSTATEYEPYTGGAPSPSPDYPQEIQVVRGRNLLDPANFVNGKYIKSSDGTEDTSAPYRHSGYVRVMPNADYYMTNGVGRGAMSTGSVYDENKAFLRSLSQAGGAAINFTFNTGSDAAFVRLNSAMPTNLSYTGEPQLSLGSTPLPYVPYGHVGMEATTIPTLYKDGYYINGNGVETVQPSGENFNILSASATNGAYELKYTSTSAQTTVRVHAYDIHGQWISQIGTLVSESTSRQMMLITAPSNTVEIRISTRKQFSDFSLTFVTPIPLPQRGWVGSLPDGTADSLRLDGAGKVEWELPTSEVVLDGSSDEGWVLAGNSKRVNCPNVNDYRVDWIHNAFYASSFIRTTSGNTHNNPTAGTASFSENASDKFFSLVRTGNVTTANNEKTWLSTHPVTVLYPLATPVTEDCGYVEDWPTDLPDSATVSIPELDAVGISYFVDSTVTELAKQWYARAYAELGAAIVELAQRVSQLEG